MYRRFKDITMSAKKELDLAVAADGDQRPKAAPNKEEKPLISSKAKFSPFFRQFLAASGPIIATLSSGMTAGFSAVLLPQLKSPNSTLKIDHDQASWIASMAALPMALGCIFSGVLMERYGRRMTQLLLCVPFLLGWVLLSLATTVWHLYVGRFLTGFSVGLLGPPSIVYIAETAEPRHRGALLATVTLAISVGILLSHVLGTFLYWKVAAAVSVFFPCLSFGLFWICPETPSWLAIKGYASEAEEAFHWLRGYSDQAQGELKVILSKKPASRSDSKEGSFKRLAHSLRSIFSLSFLKPFFIMNVFFFVQQFSGVNAVAFYSVDIMKTVSGNVDEYLATIVIDVIRVVMSLATCILLRQFGRRPLGLISLVGTTVSLLSLAAVLKTPFYKEYPSLSWLPTGLLASYICFISIGLVPLPWVMTGEVFPAAHRELGSGATSFFGFFVFFVVVKSSPFFFSTLGMVGTFQLFGGITLLGTVFIFCFLPETKNKTLEEIEDLFSKPKPKPSPESAEVV
ncbi:unnamed protein product [Bemisia tabaci]|uniref:Major facilitator superfamily (MFS) profile domain-containing protein n=2 Tax=Bemisia tabaci TaxID=7038 RepID=A0A9P0C0C4_BEMTA|nr:unnamed protein product [Bemisia tabaci]